MKLATKLVLSAAIGLYAAPLTALAQAPAPAEPTRAVSPITVVTTDETVEINVRGVVPDADAVAWRWGKLHLPLESGPGQIFAKSFDDATIKRIALVGGESPRLMVTLRHGTRTSRKLVEATDFELVDGGFRLIIPRRQSLMPAPTPAAAETVAPPSADAVAPVAAPAPAPSQPAPSAQPAAVEPAPSNAPAPVAGATVAGEPGPQIDLTADEASPLDGAAESSGSKLWTSLGLTMLLLAGGGGVVLWARRRNMSGPEVKNFTVLGNQVLGPKSRIVLMGLGQRRMLIAVSEAGTTVVDKWSEGERPDVMPLEDARPSVPSNTAFGDSTLAAIEFGMPRGDLAIRPTPARTERPSQRYVLPELDEDELQDSESSAVTGLMELRRRMEDVESPPEEEDAKWSAALAARMRAGRA